MLKRIIIVLSFGFAALSGGLCFAQANNANPAPNPIEFYNLYNNAINSENFDAAAGYAIQAWRAAEQKWGNTNPQTGALAYNAAWSQGLIGKPQDGLAPARAAVEIAPIAGDFYVLEEAKFLLAYYSFKSMDIEHQRRKVDDLVTTISPIEDRWQDTIVIDALTDAAIASLSKSTAEKSIDLSTRAITQIQRLYPQEKTRSINALLVRMQANLLAHESKNAISDIVDARLKYGRPNGANDNVWNLLNVWEMAARAVAYSSAAKARVPIGSIIPTGEIEDFSEYRTLTPEQLAQISAVNEMPNVCNGLVVNRLINIGDEIRYPSSESFSGVVGAAIIGVDISNNGSVRDAHIVSAIPSNVFAEAAIRAIRTWKYAVPANISENCLENYKVRITYVFEQE